MRITVFTSNQPRHLAYINKLSLVADELIAVVEATTRVPGVISDLYASSEILKAYFSEVRNAENRVFSEAIVSESNVRVMPIKMGDLNLLEKHQLSEAIASDIYLVFGSSYIRGWLADFLVDRGAVNIHMGLSPYYRGHSCNFWAMYDSRPEYVGATVHLLSHGLDSGPILFHSRPSGPENGPFDFTMRAVDVVQNEVTQLIHSNQLSTLAPIPQDKSLQIRYSRGEEFKDEVAANFLTRNWASEEIRNLLENNLGPDLILPPVHL